MKYVVDSNYLSNQKLVEFLKKSTSNFAVIPEFVAMEMYKGGSFERIDNALRVLSKFPNQVLIMKGGRKLLGLRGKSKGLQRRIIDEAQTKGFSDYIKKFELAVAGHQGYQKAILEHSKFADTHFEQMLSDTEEIKDAVHLISERFSKADRARIRNNNLADPDLNEKIIRVSFEITAEVLKNPELNIRIPTYEELPNTYYYRVILASFLLGLVRESESGVKAVGTKKYRNDMVDMTIISAATYFDGLMTDDERMKSMFEKLVSSLYLSFDIDWPI